MSAGGKPPLQDSSAAFNGSKNNHFLDTSVAFKGTGNGGGLSGAPGTTGMQGTLAVADGVLGSAGMNSTYLLPRTNSK
jgi:hypothetical protein